jgi:hypothetical protein
MFDEMWKELFDSIDTKNNNLLNLALTGTKGKINHMKEMLLTIGFA